jgi:hypothetical protein
MFTMTNDLWHPSTLQKERSLHATSDIKQSLATYDSTSSSSIAAHQRSSMYEELFPCQPAYHEKVTLTSFLVPNSPPTFLDHHSTFS